MPINLQGLLIALFAAVLSLLLYFPVRSLALRRNILNDSDARIFHRKPMPVLGGLVVYGGFYIGIFLLFLLSGTPRMMVAFICLTFMMLIGIWDDIKSLPAAVRVIAQVITVWALIYYGQFYFDDLHGVWGIHELSLLIAGPLSIILGVGIIQTVNIISGVDGYGAGIGLFACVLFALPLFSVGASVPACCLLILAGPLFTFLLNNAFGKRFHLYLGHAGNLLLGLSMTIAVFYLLYSGSPCVALEEQNFGLPAYTLAVLCIPIFDSLRVIICRIAKGDPTFMYDKLLHHILIESGFSHVGTSLSIIFMNLIVVLAWWISWKLGASVTWQFHIVVIFGLIITTVFPPIWAAVRKRKANRLT